MAAESSSASSRSSASADSYIGSLISLTSKSEIRYEGILYNINTEESSIGLRNVRSFGTEGRKKEGPQVPPSDKVYEYILFRGSDIKDLQVKSSPPPPPVQTTPSINSDPAIIQSHYPRPASTSASLPAAVSGSLTDPSSHPPQLGQPGSTFQGGLPLYQPGGNIGSWGPSPPPPSANGGGLAMPMYWQGYYGPPNGLPHLHQQSLIRPPPGLSMPPSLQQPLQYSGFNAGSNLPEYPSHLLPTTTNSLNMPFPSLPPSSMPTSLPPLPPTLASDTLAGSTLSKAPSPATSTAMPSSAMPSLSTLATSATPDVNAIAPPSANKSNAAVSSSALQYQTISQPMPASFGGSSGSLQTEKPTPLLVTPGQLRQPGPGAVSSSQPLQAAHKDVEVVQVVPSPSSESPVPVSKDAQPPILPLPPTSRTMQKANGANFEARHSYYRGRERGRGPGNSRAVTKFTEDFDFMAMNEKFNKDEVWGHLGKSNKSHPNEDGEGEGSDEGDTLYEDEVEKIENKPVYNKDDFFDSLSCNSMDNSSNGGRRYSEQMKIDTETFGEFSRYRGGRGGRGPGRGGRSRGSYYGRGYGYGYGYGYAGRGRGRGM